MNDEEMDMDARTAETVMLIAKIQPLLEGQYIGVILFTLTSIMVDVLGNIKDKEKRAAMTWKIIEKIFGLKPPGRRASGASTPRTPPARSS